MSGPNVFNIVFISVTRYNRSQLLCFSLEYEKAGSCQQLTFIFIRVDFIYKLSCLITNYEDLMLEYEKLLWRIDSMAENKKKLYMEMQMDELKASLGDGKEDDKENSAPKKNTTATDQKNIELAKLYEDLAEYEEELEGFEEELEIIHSNQLKDLPAALAKKLPSEDRDYGQELKAILVATWAHLAEVEKTHSAEFLDPIKEAEFCDVIEKLNATYPSYDGSFETEIKDILVKRWEALIAIKKEHIQEEEDDIYIAGLKPSFVKRIYKQVHGIR